MHLLLKMPDKCNINDKWQGQNQDAIGATTNNNAEQLQNTKTATACSNNYLSNY